MTRPSLKSRFGEQIRAFVGYKNSLGFPYNESIRILGRFDDFCVERFPEKDCLDCELALAWLEKRDTENTAGHRNRIMVIREFAKYLRAVGTEAYMIPISMTSKGPRYVPHIFNEAEIKVFFHGADSFRPHEKAPARHLVIPVFYRLLYCCGLRPAEARLLKKENVDLVRGSVYVVESKGHKDRVVAVADDLLQIMRSYSTLISEIYPDSDYFFPRYDGEGPYTKRWTEEMFWRCFSMAGITAFEGPKPRVYDFRHTFATECICRWMREGRDIDKAISNHTAKRPRKFLTSKYSNINGKALLAVLSKNFEKVPRTIPRHSIIIVFLIFLLTGISFSVLLVLFKNLFIIHL